MIQIIFLDLDGTLIPCGAKEPAFRDMEAVRYLQKQGILVFAVTGRCASQVPELGFDGVISYDGACIQDKGKTIVQGGFLEGQELEQILGCARDRGHRIVISGGSADPVQEVLEGDPVRRLRVRRASLLEDERSAEALEEALAHSCFYKGMVTAQILKILQIPACRSMAVGDGFNDMGMLAGAGVSAAMKDAPALVQACADFTADGALDALRQAGLLTEFVQSEAMAGTGGTDPVSVAEKADV